MKISKIWQFIGFLQLFFISMLGANWSSPPEVIYPLTPINNALNPYIATDLHGNSVAVWYTRTESTPSTLQGAFLPSGAVNELGQPAWVLTNQIADHVQAPQFPFIQAVGVDANGKALAAWRDDNNNILISTLVFGEHAWSSAQIINTQIPGETVTSPYVSVNHRGDAAVVWTSYDSVGLTLNLLANVFDAETQTWKGQSVIFSGNLDVILPVLFVKNDSLGNAVALNTISESDIMAYTYAFSSNTWTTVTPVTLGSLIAGNLAVDLNGVSTVIAVNTDSVVTTLTLPFGETTFVNQTTLSTTGSTLMMPVIQVASSGDALALWATDEGNLASARYSFAAQTWDELPQIVVDFLDPAHLALSLNSHGHAVAAWTAVNEGGYFIQAAILGVDDIAWRASQDLSPPDNNTEQQVVMTAKGDAVGIWSNLIDSSFVTGTINSSIFLDLFPLQPSTITQIDPFFGPTAGGNSVIIKGTHLFDTSTIFFGPNPALFIVTSDNSITAFAPAGSGAVDVIVTTPLGEVKAPRRYVYVPDNAPLPPKKIKGWVIENKFLLQTDHIHHLLWQANNDLVVVKNYNIYRNGDLIARVVADDTVFLHYDDHNRRKNERDVYEVTAVNFFDVEGDPVTLWFK